MGRICNLFLLILLVFFAGCSKDEPVPAKTLVPVLEPGILLTFDDNYYDAWIKMQPILDEYNAKATFFVSPNYPNKRQNTDYQKILTLYNAGNEIGSHSMNHPKIQYYLKKHSLEYYYQHEVLPTFSFFDSLGIKVSSFAYPYGYHTRSSDIYLELFFRKIRTVSNYAKSHNYVCIKDRQIKQLSGFSIVESEAISLRVIENEILKAKADTGIFVLVEHMPVLKATINFPFSYAMLDSICRFTVNHNMRFYCMRDL
jgi:peptidoglycan/xylan/chitin deacetylase (PgdA/CDA1 family)